MIDFIKQLQREINRKIDKIEHSDECAILKALAASCMLGDAFNRLKKFVLTYKFKNEKEEIQFFKDKKPSIVCLLIYYRKIYNIESNMPVGSIDIRKEYLHLELEKINSYTTKRLDFIRYYRAGATHMDRIYFLRAQKDTELYFETFYHEFDPKFSTNCDFKVAKILANDMLTAYLMTEIEKVDMESKKFYGFPFPDNRLTWQASKTKLLEIIYAFHTDGCFGNVSLTKIATYISNVFNVELEIKNLSRSFSDMKIRNNPIQGLDEMSNKLLKRMKRERNK